MLNLPYLYDLVESEVGRLTIDDNFAHITWNTQYVHFTQYQPCLIAPMLDCAAYIQTRRLKGEEVVRSGFKIWKNQNFTNCSAMDSVCVTVKYQQLITFIRIQQQAYLSGKEPTEAQETKKLTYTQINSFKIILTKKEKKKC